MDVGIVHEDGILHDVFRPTPDGVCPAGSAGVGDPVARFAGDCAELPVEEVDFERSR